MTNVTDDFSGFAGHPTWYPNSSDLVFSNTTALFKVSADGTGTAEQLTGNIRATELEMNPDGHTVLFREHISGGTFKISTIDLETNQITTIIPNAPTEYSPEWSTDGSRIAWSDYVNPNTAVISVADADGGNVERLTQTISGFEQGIPKFSPDDQGLAYFGLGNDIHIVDVATGQSTNLTNDGFNNNAPEWENIIANYRFSDGIV